VNNGERARLLGIHPHERVDPKPACLDFDSGGEVEGGARVKLETFKVGDSPELHVLPWPFRGQHFTLPAKGALPLDRWVLEGLSLHGEEQLMGFMLLTGLLDVALVLRGCPTGSKVVLRLCNEASAPRRVRLSLRGARL